MTTSRKERVMPTAIEVAGMFAGRTLAMLPSAIPAGITMVEFGAQILGQRGARMAFEDLFGAEDEDEPTEFDLVGDVGVLTIEGELVQRGGWFLDGHQDILARSRALAADARAKVAAFKIDSPGGDLADAYESLRTAQLAFKEAGKPVMVYASGTGAFSGGYLWAMVGGAGSKISLPDSGSVGSVGVLSTMVDLTKMADKEGARVDVVRSGSEKAEGHPFVATTDAALARRQARVDALAGIFADIVGSARGISVEDVLSMQGGIRLGADAVTAKLADYVESWDEFIGRAQAMADNKVSVQVPRGVGGGIGGQMKIMTALGEITSEAEAKVAIDRLMAEKSEASAAVAKLAADKATLEERIKSLSTATCAFVRQEALVAGRRTKAQLDADSEADAALMADLAPDKVALHTLRKYEPLPRGSALHRESEQGEGADVRPPGRRGDAAELDGAKMTATEIARVKDPAQRARLMEQYSAAQRPKDKGLFASVKTTLSTE